MDNPETLGTLGKHDTGQRQTKQKTQHRKLKRWRTPTPPENGVNSVAKGKESLPLIKHLPCNSYSQYALDSTMRKQTQITYRN